MRAGPTKLHLLWGGPGLKQSASLKEFQGRNSCNLATRMNPARALWSNWSSTAAPTALWEEGASMGQRSTYLSIVTQRLHPFKIWQNEPWRTAKNISGIVSGGLWTLKRWLQIPLLEEVTEVKVKQRGIRVFGEVSRTPWCYNYCEKWNHVLFVSLNI